MYFSMELDSRVVCWDTQLVTALCFPHALPPCESQVFMSCRKVLLGFDWFAQYGRSCFGDPLLV